MRYENIHFLELGFVLAAGALCAMPILAALTCFLLPLDW